MYSSELRNLADTLKFILSCIATALGTFLGMLVYSLVTVMVTRSYQAAWLIIFICWVGLFLIINRIWEVKKLPKLPEDNKARQANPIIWFMIGIVAPVVLLVMMLEPHTPRK